MSETVKADAIINVLRDQVNEILSSALGTTELRSFNIGSAGNMPYYWQNPRNRAFNSKTYDWINRALKSDIAPLQQKDVFTNLCIEALSKIKYSLSSDDQAALNEAQSNATDQQLAVLNAWEAAFGSLPEGNGQPIDNICEEISTKWADPATDLNSMQQSINLSTLLNKAPASGRTVLPVFANWLNAIGGAVSLMNNVTMNNAYVARALAAAQSASKSNGGLLLDNSTDTYHPAFEVSTPLSDIQNGLKNSSQSAKVSMKVTRSTTDEFQVNVQGGTHFNIPVMSLLTINVGGNSSYFQSEIATSDSETTVDMTFPGVTLVNFGPVPYDMSTCSNWYWVKPIQDAIKNENCDVSGFKFSPKPQIDFSRTGPFGFLMGAAISNYPSMVIKVKNSNYKRIQKTFEQSASVGISFLGIPLGIGGSESTYSNSVEVDSSNSTATITLNPPKELVAGTATDSVGWVLGVQSNYPAE